MNARPDIVGLVYDMPNAEYHANPALGSSGLKKLARSPQHFYAAYLDPQRPVSETTPAMRAGTLAHCALLEPHALVDRYVVRPEGLDLRTKDGKAWAASISPEFELVTAEQMRTAQRQAAAVRALPEIGALIGAGRTEVSAFAVDPQSGVMLKARPDVVAPAGNGVILVDLKTTTSASAKDFTRTIVNFGYAMQAAHYTDVYQQASGLEVLGFLFVCTESDYPHAAAAYMLPDDWLDAARKERRRLIDLYSSCSASGVWPGYSSAIQLLEMPAWLARTPLTTDEESTA